MFKRFGLLLVVSLSLAFTSAIAFADVPLDPDYVVQVDQSEVGDVALVTPADFISFNAVTTQTVAHIENRRSYSELHVSLTTDTATPSFEVGWRN